MATIWQVILASDGSEEALRAAAWLEEHFGPDAMRVTVVSIAHVSLGLGDPLYAMDPSTQEKLMEAVIADAEQAAADTAAQMTNLRPSTKTQAAADIALALLEIAQEMEADAIVVGRHGRGALGSMLLGSVSLRLLIHSTRPVWVVPPPGRHRTETHAKP